jgi:hypothetical protein
MVLAVPKDLLDSIKNFPAGPGSQDVAMVLRYFFNNTLNLRNCLALAVYDLGNAIAHAPMGVHFGISDIFKGKLF